MLATGGLHNHGVVGEYDICLRLSNDVVLRDEDANVGLSVLLEARRLEEHLDGFALVEVVGQDLAVDHQSGRSHGGGDPLELLGREVLDDAINELFEEVYQSDDRLEHRRQQGVRRCNQNTEGNVQP